MATRDANVPAASNMKGCLQMIAVFLFSILLPVAVIYAATWLLGWK